MTPLLSKFASYTQSNLDWTALIRSLDKCLAIAHILRRHQIDFIGDAVDIDLLIELRRVLT
jgi:hypothetical protein